MPRKGSSFQENDLYWHKSAFMRTNILSKNNSLFFSKSRYRFSYALLWKWLCTRNLKWLFMNEVACLTYQDDWDILILISGSWLFLIIGSLYKWFTDLFDVVNFENSTHCSVEKRHSYSDMRIYNCESDLTFLKWSAISHHGYSPYIGTEFSSHNIFAIW